MPATALTQQRSAGARCLVMPPFPECQGGPPVTARCRSMTLLGPALVPGPTGGSQPRLQVPQPTRPGCRSLSSMGASQTSMASCWQAYSRHMRMGWAMLRLTLQPWDCTSPQQSRQALPGWGMTAPEPLAAAEAHADREAHAAQVHGLAPHRDALPAAEPASELEYTCCPRHCGPSGPSLPVPATCHHQAAVSKMP